MAILGLDSIFPISMAISAIVSGIVIFILLFFRKIDLVFIFNYPSLAVIGFSWLALSVLISVALSYTLQSFEKYENHKSH